MIPVITHGEARLLFALLDAADDDGLLRHAPGVACWHDAKARIAATEDYRSEAGLLWTLLEERDEEGALNGSWIQSRWRFVKTQVKQATRPVDPD